MRQTIMVLLICICGITQAQNSASKISQAPPISDISSRYKIDFDIKGIEQPSLVLLNSIDIEQYEYLRKEDESIEVYDSVTGLVIILYSKEIVSENKSKKISEPGFKRQF